MSGLRLLLLAKTGGRERALPWLSALIRGIEGGAETERTILPRITALEKQLRAVPSAHVTPYQEAAREFAGAVRVAPEGERLARARALFDYYGLRS